MKVQHTYPDYDILLISWKLLFLSNEETNRGCHLNSLQPLCVCVCVIIPHPPQTAKPLCLQEVHLAEKMW